MADTDPHELVEVVVGDRPDAWREAGFAVDEGTVTIGATTIRLLGDDAERGIRAVGALGLDGPVDGLPFASGAREPIGPGGPHPNRVVAIDHLVALSPHMDRTTAALEAAGLEARRTRRFEVGGATRRQTFFWLGGTILELAGADDARDDGPASLWGLALTCDDLDEAVGLLGPRLGAPRSAVQPGRRIATVRTRDLDISVPIALMSPHPVRSGRA